MNEEKENIEVKKRKRGRPSLKETINKDEILKIALQAFAESGFDGVSINAISKRANVGDSLLHYHFGNKTSLWQKAMETALKNYKEDSNQAVKMLKDLEPISLSKAMTRHFIHFSAKNPEFFQIILHEVAQKSERSIWLEEQVINVLSERFFKHHKMLAELGLVIPLPIGNMVSIFLGACNTFFTFHQNMKRQLAVDVFDEKEVDRHADLVIQMLYHGMMK